MSKPVFAEGVTSPRPRIRTNSFRSQLVVHVYVVVVVHVSRVQRNPFSISRSSSSLPFSRSREKIFLEIEIVRTRSPTRSPPSPNIFKGNVLSIDVPHHEREHTDDFSSRVRKQLLCFFRSLARPPRREVFHPDQGFNLKIPHSEAIRPYGSKALDTRAPQYRNRVMNHARYSSRENR